MRGTLKWVRMRVERVSEPMQEESAGDVQEELIARQMAGRQRGARATKTGDKPPRPSDEEIHTRARELRAALRAEGILR
jgi:hypothetical protein